MSRSVKEWIGKTDDSVPPPRVKKRVFDAHGGICHIAKRKIQLGELWDCDHVIAITNGGKNRESNLAPALRDKHRIKTKTDVAEKSAVATKRKKHLGLTKPKRGFRGWRKFNGDLVWREPAKSVRREGMK